MRINTFERVLDSKTFATDMLYFPVIVLVYGFHNQFDQQWRLAPQFSHINLHCVIRAVYRFSIVDKIGHFHEDSFRLIGIFHIKYSNYRLL